MANKSFPVTVLGIAGVVGAGTSLAAKGVVWKLGWKSRSGGGAAIREQQAIDDMMHLPLQKYIETTPGLDKRIDGENRRFVLQYQDTGCVLDARLVIPAMVDLECARTILLYCNNDQVRAKRVMERDKCNHARAFEELKRDADDRVRLKEICGFDFDDPTLYDLAIDTERHDAAETLRQILEFIQRVPAAV